MAGEKAYLDKAIGRYPPEVAGTARAALKKLRARFPGARQVVYDRRQSLPIGFAPAAGGAGNKVRSIRVDKDAAVLDDPYIHGLMAQAVKEARADLVSGNRAGDGAPARAVGYVE